MTQNQPHLSAPAKAPLSRSLKLVLTFSLALNVAVVGLFFGSFLRDGPHRARVAMGDVSFGAYNQALSPESRQALRQAFRDNKAPKENLRFPFESVVAALRAEPFDPSAFASLLEEQAKITARRYDMGQTLFNDHISDLSKTERQAFANRLETMAKRAKIRRD